MESRSLLLNDKLWKIRPLGEKEYLLEPEFEDAALQEIHALHNLLEHQEAPELSESIPAYRSIALIFRKEVQSSEHIVQFLERLTNEMETTANEGKTFEVPVCFDLGLDWEHVITHTGLNKDEVINKFESGEYLVAMIGFLPGFVFLEGLNPSLSVPRRSSPRVSIPAGSIGIGAAQTGIYSIESPGGWNIIGRTPHNYFDLSNEPPVKFTPGDRLRFKSISRDEFFKLKGESGHE